MASHTTNRNPRPTLPREPPTPSAHDGAVVLSQRGGQHCFHSRSPHSLHPRLLYPPPHMAYVFRRPEVRLAFGPPSPLFIIYYSDARSGVSGESTVLWVQSVQSRRPGLLSRRHSVGRLPPVRGSTSRLRRDDGRLALSRITRPTGAGAGRSAVVPMAWCRLGCRERKRSRTVHHRVGAPRQHPTGVRRLRRPPLHPAGGHRGRWSLRRSGRLIDR